MPATYSWAAFGRSPGSIAIASPEGAPSIVGAALTGQKETEGTANVVAALGSSAAGLILIGLDAVRTSIRSGPALNNSNTFAAALTFEDYSPGFPQYDLVARAVLAAAGGSAHQSTLTKSSATTEEATNVLLAVLGGTVVEATSVNRVSTSGVATHTSAAFNIAGTNPARVFAFASGSGFSTGATVQDLQMASAGWSDIIGTVNGTGGQLFKFVHSGVTAPSGHIPLRGWTRTLSPGTGYTWQVTPDFQVAAGQAEGAVMITIVVR